MKKAQGLSLNMIVIAAIVVIVLIVLVVVFSGKMKFFGSSTSDASSEYTSDQEGQRRCEIPGTNNECGLDLDECRAEGGVFDESDDWDCSDGCCMK